MLKVSCSCSRCTGFPHCHCIGHESCGIGVGLALAYRLWNTVHTIGRSYVIELYLDCTRVYSGSLSWCYPTFPIYVDLHPVVNLRKRSRLFIECIIIVFSIQHDQARGSETPLAVWAISDDYHVARVHPLAIWTVQISDSVACAQYISSFNLRHDGESKMGCLEYCEQDLRTAGG